tara:strand:+ start:35 stop:628 length:594 start_codon:yes stop_codon:yes gene_type:complete
MAGLGKYKKGAKFTLKSGNTPLFKHVGSSPSPITSPANMNNFGVGKGTSPLDYKIKKGDTLSEIAAANNTTVEAIMKANPSITDPDKIIAGNELAGIGEDNTSENGAGEGENGAGAGENTGDGTEVKVDPKTGLKVKPNWKNVGIAALSHGLDAVYGSGKIAPPGSARLVKDPKDEKVKDDTLDVENILNLKNQKTK